MVIAVMLDLKKKETYVERYQSDKVYLAVLNKNSDTKHPTSIFSNVKDAKREAGRVAKLLIGWIYNEKRNRLNEIY